MLPKEFAKKAFIIIVVLVFSSLAFAGRYYANDRSCKPSINITIGASGHGHSSPCHSRRHSRRMTRYEELMALANKPRYKSRSTELKTSLPDEPTSSYSFDIGGSSLLSKRTINVNKTISSVKTSGVKSVLKEVTVIEHKPRMYDTETNHVAVNNFVTSNKTSSTHNYKSYSGIRKSSARIHYLDRHQWCNCGLFHLVKWSPSSCSRLVYFGKGHTFGVSYIYPEHHRKYVFVSVGSHRPIDHRCLRYYQYGCHPGRWYGTHPADYPVLENTTYNTYNYYQAEEVTDPPADQTLADIHFENAANAFESRNYNSAIVEIMQAISSAPQDQVLPFTLAQAYFAAGQYTEAAIVLRQTFKRMPRDKETIYYPRGLYADEMLLAEQIEMLQAATQVEPYNADVNLLMAYHMLGMGNLADIQPQLEKASLNDTNKVAVVIMTDLLEQAQKGDKVDLQL